VDIKTNQNNIYAGTALAVLACIIWSGNFIVARGISALVPPISLAFFRWSTATLFILPFTWKKMVQEKAIITGNRSYFFWTALTGITLYNTFIYLAGHYIPAVNLALIGTTSAPIFAIILARIFLKEKITLLRVAGVIICISAILLLISKGSFQRLVSLQFSAGDGWILLAAFWFAIYTILVRKKPQGISPLVFLSVIFTIGTLLLFPFFVWEQFHSAAIPWSRNIVLIIVYLGLGNSVISYLCWNLAITRLGAARTALFGNLIPVFGSIEAVLLLHETMTAVHYISMALVIVGLIIANLTFGNKL
jgi:drug/metabolite transporter (DMT)-like permease